MAVFAGPSDPLGLVRVIDADTWDVGGTRVRLFGIDAPELDQTCDTRDGQNWACGGWVSAQVRQMYDGRRARCTALTLDRYDRTVARCFVDDVDVGRQMVADGWAFAYRRYSMDYDLDEKGAAINARGLHGHQVQSPAEFRAIRSDGVGSDVEPPADTCTIKGNISSRGTRIYHLPGQRDYGKTRISATKGEHWFCTEPEAQAAGWRKARR